MSPLDTSDCPAVPWALADARAIHDHHFPVLGLHITHLARRLAFFPGKDPSLRRGRLATAGNFLVGLIDDQRFSCDLRLGTPIISVHAGLVQPKIRFRKK